jgi:hypothetical protein
MPKRLYKIVYIAGVLLIAAGCNQNTSVINPVQNTPAIKQKPIVQPSIVNSQSSESQSLAKECIDSPTVTEIGRDVYPIADKYKQLQFLGQLFTASDCGTERLSKIFGVKNGQYTQGATITLNAPPSVKFLATLKVVGFICSEQKIESQCSQWQLEKSVNVKDILKLKPFADKIKQDDCYICG